MGLSGNALAMKEVNVNLVRKTLKKMKQATKQQIAQTTGLSVVTVTSVLHQLKQTNELLEINLVASNGGRPAQQYCFNEKQSHVLVLFAHTKDGIDLLHIKVANLYGECVYEIDEELSEITLQTFEPYIERALKEYPTIRAIGFGMPGIEWGGKIILLDYKNLIHTEFSKYYSTRFHIPVMFENDVNSAVIGYCGRKQIDTDAATVYIYFPQKYPPGAGIYMNGKLYKGLNGFAGEIANIPFGIDWCDPELYLSHERSCEAIKKTIIAICCLLNPHSIILHGSFLTSEHIETIRQECSSSLPGTSMPEISSSENYLLDYQNGIITKTLAELEPRLVLSN